MKNNRQNKGWPPERRAKMRRLILARKPWLKSTGPKTTEGKQKARYNGLKHGRHIALYRNLRSALYGLYHWSKTDAHVPRNRFENHSHLNP